MAEKHTHGAVCLARNLEQRSGKEQINALRSYEHTNGS